jgi:hypothetical protein
VQSEQARDRARSGWWTATGTVGVVGCVAALVMTPPRALLASVVVLAAVALLVATAVGAELGPEGTTDWWRLLDQTLVGTAGAVAALGLLQVSVAATALIALVLGGTAPWALSARWGRGTWSGGRRPVTDSGPTAVDDVGAAAEAATDPQVVEDLRLLPTPELVLAWRRSYAGLLRERTPAQIAAHAERRQRLLDELERRDAAGVERWLRSGARAASDPTRFLQRPAGPTSAAA